MADKTSDLKEEIIRKYWDYTECSLKDCSRMTSNVKNDKLKCISEHPNWVDIAFDTFVEAILKTHEADKQDRFAIIKSQVEFKTKELQSNIRELIDENQEIMKEKYDLFKGGELLQDKITELETQLINCHKSCEMLVNIKNIDKSKFIDKLKLKQHLKRLGEVNQIIEGKSETIRKVEEMMIEMEKESSENPNKLITYEVMWKSLKNEQLKRL